MSCEDLDSATKRISTRLGSIVDLDMQFRNANGVYVDPYAIRKVEIYKTQVLPHNLVATAIVDDPWDTSYPSPLCREYVQTEEGDCGTEPEDSEQAVTGKYHFLFDVPTTFIAPDVYIDVWYYHANNPCDTDGDGETDVDCDLNEYDDQLLRCCNRFWVYADITGCINSLQTIRFGFEPLDQRFREGESRPLEVGIMPLPLYDYNQQLYNSIIPALTATIKIETVNRELLVDGADCRIGIRQGSFRSNPFVFQYDLDTSLFLIGTYRYWLIITLPDGSTRVSGKYIFTIS